MPLRSGNRAAGAWRGRPGRGRRPDSAGSRRRSTCCTPSDRASARSPRRTRRLRPPRRRSSRPHRCRGGSPACRPAMRPHPVLRPPCPSHGRPRAARRRSSNKACPALRSRDATSCTAPAGSPAARSAGRNACSTIACAVPNASEPIRNTTVLPLRSTPHASANTFGRPSNTKPTTPSGARRSSTDQPSCDTRSMVRPRSGISSRHVRRPATMSRRIVSDSTSRVVERPAALAASHIALRSPTQSGRRQRRQRSDGRTRRRTP